MKYSELEKLLKKSGCTIKREGSNHSIWYSPKTGKSFPVGRHRTEDVRPGTLKSIKRDAGLE
jgi:predicted RNA binding protein YcfA (HicA-like mRNA interferase family)